MYNFLKLYGVNIHSAYRTPSVQETMKKCLFCNFYHRTITPSDQSQLRYHSSTINRLILSSVGKKKLRRRSKKYAELLEVTDSSTSNRKAAVQNLNAAQLSVLVNQPDITLDKLHKIRNKYSTKNSKSEKNFYSNTVNLRDTIENSNASKAEFSELTNALSSDVIKDLKKMDDMLFDVKKDDRELLIQELESSGITDEAAIIKSSNLAHSFSETNDEIMENHELPFKKSKHKVKRKISEKLDHLEKSEEKVIDKERKAKEAAIHKEKLKQFNQLLLSYMKVCLNTNSLSLGKNLLYAFRKCKSQKRYLYINEISVYNSYIEKLAFHCDLKGILEILQNIREYDITLNAQTYAYVFECIGRMENDKEYKLNILKHIEVEMNNDGIKLNDVITKSNFIHDQRTFVQSAIKLLDNQFTPIYEEPDIAYNCRLLENLFEDSATPCSTVEGILKVSDFQDRLKKQVDLEVDGQLIVRNIAKQNRINEITTFYRNKLDSLEKKWNEVALQAFKRNLIALKTYEMHSQRRKINLYPYLETLKPEDYVRILITEARQLAMGSEMYSLPYNTLCRKMGHRVYKMYEIQVNQNNGVNKKTSDVYIQYCDWFINRNDKLNSRKKWTLLEHEANKEGVTLGVQLPSWQSNILASIGSFLFNIILNDFKFGTSLLKKKSYHGQEHYQTAFFKIFRHSGVLLKEEVKPHPLLTKLYKDSEPETLAFDATLVPAFCPPRPWISIRSGGYIVTKTDIVRLSYIENQQWDRLVKSPANKLYPALDSLNQLGTIPWAINSAVLDVAIKVFQNDGSVELNMPQPPSVLSNIPPAPKNSDPDVRKKIHKARMELKRKKNEMYSLWCDALYRLSLANHLRNEIFWLPHNMDFRGRVYPVPPHLNHLGSDLARSILIFALKKPLGPNGLKWLKLHTINLTGFKKKEPINERLRYADEIMDKILDSAEKPLTGEMWWSTSDEPWQTLAACMEISSALKSPNPEEYESGFPIHQDGSCNGLQHYAALGRDQIGAESVNLNPSESPQDVYSSVATMVDERRKEDAKNGIEIAQILEGFIQRKVIKQTVMTTVYGVTWFGAKLQIARQLKDIDDFPQEHLWSASTYLVNKTFQTLRTMFKSAREIQDWFTECSRLICICRAENMEWVTPLGLPVVQPYSKIHLPSLNKKGTSICFTPDILGKPHIMKQKNAFPPNFVHSLDSSHMMLTSINSEHVGIMFVSVHDCYWTHPCTVEIMNKVCREQFVALHSEPILEDLSSFLIQKFGYDELNKIVLKKGKKMHLLQEKLNKTLISVPKQGDFDLSKVLSSTYFFS